MAIGTAMAALSVMQAGVAAGQAIFGSRQQKKAQAVADSALSSMEGIINQGMVNQYSGLQVPTGAYDLATEQLQATVADQTRMLQEGGPEAAIGGVGRLVQAAGQQQRESSAKLGEQEFELDKLVAEEESRLQDVKYQGKLGSKEKELFGAQQAAAEGRQNLMAGLGGIAGAAGSAFGFLGQMELAKKRGKTPSIGYGYGPNGSY
jgi:hypothetical protein